MSIDTFAPATRLGIISPDYHKLYIVNVSIEDLFWKLGLQATIGDLQDTQMEYIYKLESKVSR